MIGNVKNKDIKYSWMEPILYFSGDNRPRVSQTPTEVVTKQQIKLQIWELTHLYWQTVLC